QAQDIPTANTKGKGKAVAKAPQAASTPIVFTITAIPNNSEDEGPPEPNSEDPTSSEAEDEFPFKSYHAWDGQPVNKTTVSLSDIVSNLEPGNFTCFLKGHKMLRQDRFVHLCMVDPHLVMDKKQHGWLVLKRTTTPAILIMLGVPSISHLLTPGTITTLDGEADEENRRFIAVVPIGWDCNRMGRNLGSVLRFSSLGAPCLRGAGLFFCTKRPSDDDLMLLAGPDVPSYNVPPPPLTTVITPTATSCAPFKKGKFIKTRSADDGAERKSYAKYDYPVTKAFADYVPIYDGRASAGHPFNFTAQEFKDLPSRPLWNGGREELIPDENVVAVGYTLTSWPAVYSSSSATATPPPATPPSDTSEALGPGLISLYAQFVIVLQ
ncbi:hypothetical protein BDN72DRAFT_866277, partial [Pluteus cervinus]